MPRRRAVVLNPASRVCLAFAAGVAAHRLTKAHVVELAVLVSALRWARRRGGACLEECIRYGTVADVRRAVEGRGRWRWMWGFGGRGLRDGVRVAAACGNPEALRVVLRALGEGQAQGRSRLASAFAAMEAEGESPLYAAALHAAEAPGGAECVQMLLGAGANAGWRNREGLRAIDVASTRKVQLMLAVDPLALEQMQAQAHGHAHEHLHAQAQAPAYGTPPEEDARMPSEEESHLEVEVESVVEELVKEAVEEAAVARPRAGPEEVSADGEAAAEDVPGFRFVPEWTRRWGVWRVEGRGRGACFAAVRPEEPLPFGLRGANYLKDRRKVAPAAGSGSHEFAGAEVIVTARKLEHASRHAADLFPERLGLYERGLEVSARAGVPGLLVVNWMFPEHTPSLFGPGAADGKTVNVLFFFLLSERAAAQLRDDPSSPRARLLRGFLEGDKRCVDRFKWISGLTQSTLDDSRSGLNVAERSLIRGYNYKPLLTRPQHASHRGPGVLELDVDVHRFCYPARRAFAGLLPKAGTLDGCTFAWTLEGRRPDELPETLGGAGFVSRMARHCMHIATPNQG